MPGIIPFAEYQQLSNIIVQCLDAAPQSDQFRIDQATAERQSATNHFFPTAELFANAQAEKQFPYRAKSPLKPTPESTLTANAGLSVSQNLYNGGDDISLSRIADAKLSVARLQQEKSNASLSIQTFKDILELTLGQQQVQQKIQNVEQMKLIDKATIRKTQSGFLGKKDKLQSNIELLRQSSAMALLQGNLDTKIARFNLTNQLSKNPLKMDQLRLIDKEVKSYCLSVPKNQIEFRNLDLTIEEERVEIALQNYHISSSRVHQPRLDLVGTASVRVPDNGSRDSAVLPDKSFQTALALQLNVPLYDGTKSARSDADFAEYNLTKSEYNRIKIQIENAQQTQIQNTSVLEIYWKLLTQSQIQAQELANQNQRLFDAGQLDFFVLLDSQRNLFQSQLDLIAAEYDYLRSKCNARLQQDFGVVPEFEK